MIDKFIKEDVPSFTRRIGDRVIEGSNNTIMILGTDRAATGDASISAGYVDEVKAGAWHVIVGRASENPNFDSDSAYLYLSMKTDADRNMKTSNLPKRYGVDSNGVSAFLAKSDVTRIVSRQNIKLIVGKSSIFISNDEIVIDSPSLRFGTSSKLNEMDRSDLVKKAILEHIHPSPAGPTSQAIPDQNITKINQDFINVKY